MVCGPGTDPPLGPPPAPLRAVVRVVGRRSHTSNRAFTFPCTLGMPGSRLARTPSYLILVLPPPLPLPLVHKPLLGSLAEREELG